MFNQKYCISGSQDSKLCLWDLTKRKPIWIIKEPHGPGNWITSVAALKYRKLCVSGSYDGFIHFWKIENLKLILFYSIPLKGYINEMKFSDDGKFLAIQVSNEQKLGRWLPIIKEAKQGIYIIKLIE